MKSLSSAIKRSPLLYRLARRLHYKLRGYPEPEMGLLRDLVDPGRVAIEAVPALAALVGRGGLRGRYSNTLVFVA